MCVKGISIFKYWTAVDLHMYCPASSTSTLDIINIPSVPQDITGLSGPVYS